MRRNSIVTMKGANDTGITQLAISTLIVNEQTSEIHIKTANSTANTITDGLADNTVVPINSLVNLSQLLTVDGVGSGLDADFVRGLPADFTKTGSGKNITQILPSGLIFQTGSINKNVNSGTSTHAYNITFPTTCYNVFIMQYDGTTSNIGYILRLNGFTNSNFTVNEDNFNTNGKNNASRFTWFAYGV